MTARTSADDLLGMGRVGPWLADATGDDRWLTATGSLIAGGKSNLTFELSCQAGRLVMRRPPGGTLLPSAHDMAREVRVQRALATSNVPVPRIVAADLEGGVLGVPCYVMEKVAGHVVRDALPPGYATTREDRLAVAEGLVDTLVALHAIDPDEVGLGDFGRPEGFTQRQVRRWQSQWEASRTDAVPAVDELARRLAARVPEPAGTTVVHGDFKLDNCLLDPAAPGSVAAVLDWELSSRAEPLTDVGLFLFYWREAGEVPSALAPSVSSQPGFPDRAHLARHYAHATGIDVRELDYFHAFGHFKFAVIAQGVAARAAAGALAGQQFGDLEHEVRHFAELGLTALEGPA